MFLKPRLVGGVIHFVFFPILYAIRKISSVPTGPVDKERDSFEISILKNMLERNVPVLGICRGAQLINVCLGGTLHRETAGFYTEVPAIRSILPRKEVQVHPDSRLAAVCGTCSLAVNALNHQAVDSIGTGLAVSSQEKNGIIQAIEHREKAFLIGVQWHPEYLQHLPEQRKLFKALVNAARKRRETVENAA